MKLFFFLFSIVMNLNLLADHPRVAIQRLIDGNKRYVADRLEHPNRTSESREAVVKAQNPFAVVLGCADSRVAPEIIFDQGIGDLFVVRVAGNVAGSLELESIQFAVENLGSAVVLVLGHENCGAVNAVVNHQTGDIQSIAELIEPAVKVATKESGNLLENAIQANVENVVKQLKQTPFMSTLLQQNKVAVMGGVYHLATGKVDFL